MKKVTIFIIILATLIRLISINQSLWLDEAINVLAVKNNSLIDLITKYTIYDFHPPLYHIILFFWTKLFGFSEIIVRLPSLFFGVAAVAIIYKIGKDFFSERLGVVAALLMAISPLHIYYSQEARMYSLTCLLATASCYALINLTKEKNLKSFFLYTSLIFLGMYTDYLFWFLALSFTAYLFISNKVNKKFVLYNVIILFIAQLPWLAILSQQLLIGINQAQTSPIWGSVVGSASLKSLLLVPVKFSIGRISFYNKVIYALYLIPTLLLNCSILLLTIKSYKSKLSPILWWLFPPIVISYVISIYVPVFSYFRLLFTLPAFLFIISFWIVNNKKRGTILLVVICLSEFISSQIYLTSPAFHREDWKSAVSYIERNSIGESTSLLVNLAQDAPYNYYSKGIVNINGPEALKYSYDTIWFIRYAQPIFDPEENVQKNVDSLGYKKISESDFNGVTVWKYIK